MSYDECLIKSNQKKKKKISTLKWMTTIIITYGMVMMMIISWFFQLSLPFFFIDDDKSKVFFSDHCRMINRYTLLLLMFVEMEFFSSQYPVYDITWYKNMVWLFVCVHVISMFWWPAKINQISICHHRWWWT